MNHSTINSLNFTNSAIKTLFVVLISISVLFLHQTVQSRGIDNYHIDEAERLTENEASEYLTQMRYQSFAETYVFQFRLKHYPPRARTKTYYGSLFGIVDPISGTQIERLIIQDNHPQYPRERITLNDILLIRGATARVWSATPTPNHSSEGMDVNEEANTGDSKEPLEPIEDLHSPIIENVTLSYFDLLAPYFHWSEFMYLGPEQIKARPTQSFSLKNPATAEIDQSIADSVEIHLDDEFKAILKAMYYDADDNRTKTMELISIKRTSGTSIPKTIDYRDYLNKGNKTRIDIRAAALNIELPAELFQVDNLGKPLPHIEPYVLDVF